MSHYHIYNNFYKVQDINGCHDSGIFVIILDYILAGLSVTTETRCYKGQVQGHVFALLAYLC